MVPGRAVPQPPLQFDATPESLLAAAEGKRQHATRVVDKILTEVSPSNATFANCILPLIEAENERIHNDPPTRFLSRASPSEEVRDASRQAERLLSGALADLLSRQELYDLAVAVMNSLEEMRKLDSESKEYLRRLRHSLVERGFGVPAGAQRDRYRDIRKRIEHLKMDIQKNFSKENEGVWLARDRLDGVSEDVLSSLQTRDSGELWLKLNSSAFYSVRSEATKASTRKEIYIKNAHRSSENAPLVRELFVLRDEAARLLGYKSHAAFRLETNLVSTPEEVITFIQEFQHDMAPHIRQFMQELVDVKTDYLRTHPQEAWDDPQKIFLWDIFFYRRLIQERKYQGDEMKSYFPLEHTVPEMLDVLGSHFQVCFENVETSGTTSLIWHEDVMMYRVWHRDQGGAFMGYFYYDLYERPGKIPQCTAYSVQKVHIASTTALFKANLIGILSER
jgi:metallopeptidase MepB